MSLARLALLASVLSACDPAILGGPTTQTTTHDCPLVPGVRCPTGYDCPSPMEPKSPCQASSGQDVGDPNAESSGVFQARRPSDAGADAGR